MFYKCFTNPLPPGLYRTCRNPFAQRPGRPFPPFSRRQMFYKMFYKKYISGFLCPVPLKYIMLLSVQFVFRQRVSDGKWRGLFQFYRRASV
jgi:hypothetical protein